MPKDQVTKDGCGTAITRCQPPIDTHNRDFIDGASWAAASG
jgi:hypothetical protein